MTDQELPGVVQNARRGGEEKTTVETDLSSLLANAPQHERVLLMDMDPQPSDEGWIDPDQPATTAMPSTSR